MTAASPDSPKDAPWDNLPSSLRAQMGAIKLDLAAKYSANVFHRDLAAANSILAEAAGVHDHHKVFQWSYYYDAKERWWRVYPVQWGQELLTAKNNNDMTSALKVLFDADGTVPVKIAGPMKNPQREMIWTRPYLDVSGKGMMVALLAPVYLGSDY